MERRFGFPIPSGPHAAVPGIVTRPQPENRVVVPHRSRSDHYHDLRVSGSSPESILPWTSKDLAANGGKLQTRHFQNRHLDGKNGEFSKSQSKPSHMLKNHYYHTLCTRTLRSSLPRVFLWSKVCLGPQTQNHSTEQDIERDSKCLSPTYSSFSLIPRLSWNTKGTSSLKCPFLLFRNPFPMQRSIQGMDFYPCATRAMQRSLKIDAYKEVRKSRFTLSSASWSVIIRTYSIPMTV